MKLSHKLVMVSVAALMGISPAVGAAQSITTVQAATKSSVYKTYGKNSRVTAKKTMHFVNRNGKKTGKKAYKGGKYTIWLVTRIDGKLYYAIETDGKYWIPASETKGKVSYSTKANKKTTKKNSKKAIKKVAKKTNKKSSKTTKKVVKKASKKTSKKSKAVKSVNLITVRRTPVVDKNGKKVKTYMGSKKWTIIGKKVRVVGHGTKTIDGEKYYALDPNHFISASDVKTR